ncbi:conserved hypothetical protein [Nitrobacter hamburgensis X14]|uniref:Gene transfer agent (GTA) like protein n=1 Tax=Nitrobacter hamburgensis (strain DSM 10229 / NCIMB 13809 / X14) TaxID=323097 RepID=Q1QKH9_NITHX|nr:gene transfer agent family protein [Nitrobacter hamburgensis]ABE63268.1 conserved hypothetical protein [Nitrobacter hamburgensis X14]
MTDECARTVTWDETTHNLSLNRPWVRNVLSYRGIPGENGSSLTSVMNRFETGTYSIEDVERVLELGLIGAGMPERDADALLNQYVRTKPLADNAGIAAGLVVALFLGANKETA